MAISQKEAIAEKLLQAKKRAEAAKRAAQGIKASKAGKAVKLVTMPELTGDPEKDSAADLDAVAEGFRNRAKQEKDRFELVTDSEYWTCICFQSRAQCDQFLEALKLTDIGDKYLDGLQVAKRLGVKIDPVKVPYNTSAKVNKKLAAMVK